MRGWASSGSAPPNSGAFATNAVVARAVSEDVLLAICGVARGDLLAAPQWRADLLAVPTLVATSQGIGITYLEHALTLLAHLLGKVAHYRPAHLPDGEQGSALAGAAWLERADLEHAAQQVVGLVWQGSTPKAVATAVRRAAGDAVQLGFLQQRRCNAEPRGIRGGVRWTTIVSATPYGLAEVRAALTDVTVEQTEGRAADDESGAANQPMAPILLEYEQRLAAMEQSYRRHAEEMLQQTLARVKRLKPSAATATAAPARHEQPDPKYAWARQVELVRATNQVLGRGILHRGVLSRACADREIDTNAKTGQASRVEVTSFLAWLTRSCQISEVEQTQVRNAIVGEIIARNKLRTIP